MQLRPKLLLFPLFIAATENKDRNQYQEWGRCDGPDHLTFVPWTFSGREVEDFGVLGQRAVECLKLNKLLWELEISTNIM